MDIGIVSKATLGKLLSDGVECIWAFLSTYIPPSTELNWTLLTTSVSVLKVRVQRNLKGKHEIKLFVSVSNNPEYS